MITALVAFAMLCLLLVAWTQYFWSMQVQRLVDKVMSGNYQAYANSKNPPPPAPIEGFIPPEMREDLGSISGVNVY